MFGIKKILKHSRTFKNETNIKIQSVVTKHNRGTSRNEINITLQRTVTNRTSISQSEINTKIQKKKHSGNAQQKFLKGK